MLEIENLTVSYGPIQAVSGVTLRVEPSQTFAVLGPNGAGKTSLGRACVGLERHGGSVVLDGVDLSHQRPDQRSRAGLGYVPSSGRVFPNLTVRENIAMGKPIDPAFWSTLVERFPILAEKAKQRAGLLSGGQQQLLSIARALAARPRYLVLDEPSAGLAPVVVEEIFDILGDLPGDPVGVLLLEQNASLGLEIAGDGAVLVRGEVRLTGSAQDLAGTAALEELYLGMAAVPVVSPTEPD